jgi:hypothetical protein
MDRNEILKKLPLDLTWRQAARLIGDEVVLPLWRASGEALGLDDTLNATDCVRLADAAVKAGKPPPSDVKNEWRHDRRKRRSTEHVRSENLSPPTNKPEPMTEPEESLSDARAYQDYVQEYRARISDEWRIPTIIEDRRRLKKQKYNEMGQEAGSEEITEEDEEKAEPEKSLSDGSLCDRARKEYIDRVTNSWRMK